MESELKFELETVEELINEFFTRLKAEAKPSVTDLVRLVDLKKDMDQETPKEITVQWVEPPIDAGLNG